MTERSKIIQKHFENGKTFKCPCCESSLLTYETFITKKINDTTFIPICRICYYKTVSLNIINFVKQRIQDEELTRNIWDWIPEPMELD